MRRDAKLGLALGMLVLGLASAFCFPRRPASAPWLTIETPIPIADSELEFLPIRAYPPAPAAADPLAAAPVMEPPVVALVSGPTPDPIPRNPQADTSGSPSEVKIVTPVDPNTLPTRYRVKAGDTLSGIASRLLGTSQRYSEIYEANAGLLGSPDNLQVGMELQIPPKLKLVALSPPEPTGDDHAPVRK